jgi:uncharacterized protein (DUF1684 family)
MNMSFMGSQGSRRVHYTIALLVGVVFLMQGRLLAQQIGYDTYHQEIIKHRAHEDSVFKHGEKSPLTPEAKATFKALVYFPVNEAYRVKAKFVRTANEGIFKMPTTGPRTPEYSKYGELHFTLNGQNLALNAYQNQDLMKQVQYANYLFIPFTDATTGQETYATGRYIDFTIPMGTDSVWVDFNKAYNPYCAYSDGYSCPIPPKENKLPVRIEAGVLAYGKSKPKTIEIAVDIMPIFPGGNEAMYQFIGQHFRMPKTVRKAGVEGVEIITFVVKTDGTLTDIKSVQSLHPDLFQETTRVVKLMPRWTPGMYQGKPVDVRYAIPFKISLR